ncbi:MAG: hypothetical protein JWN04_1364 [Myxococcaceae bacterium]|nr:hypothetical protein [Myxococcaceae bacterium]
MSWSARSVVTFSALIVSGCGRIGLELLDPSAGLQDSGPAAFPDAAAPSEDASSDADAATAHDGGEALADGSLSAGDAGPKAVASDAAVGDAQVSACVPGFADCDGTPTTCETPLGTVAHCSSCSDVCPANGGTAVCSAGACATVCNMTGTYAVKIASPLTWPAAVVNGGTGSSNLWARLSLTQAGNTLSGTVEPCGITLPDFSLNPALGAELYQLYFPSTLFDHVPAYIPTSAVAITSSSGFTIAQPLSFPNLAIMVGASLTNPLTDPWPSAAALAAPDVDADGKPGVTGLYSNTGGHTYPRADAILRVDQAYAGARFVLSGSGNLASCTDLTLSGAFAHFDTHIVSCHIAGGGDCIAAQRDTVDGNRPAFAATTASMHVVKAAAGITCTQVRALVP